MPCDKWNYGTLWIVAVNNPSLVVITESWLKSNILAAAIKISKKFNAYEHDRHTLGSGVFAYVHYQMPTTASQILK